MLWLDSRHYPQILSRFLPFSRLLPIYPLEYEFELAVPSLADPAFSVSFVPVPPSGSFS